MLTTTRTVKRCIWSENVLLEPIQGKDGKWYWRVKSFAFDADIYDEENNSFASVKVSADTELDLLIKKGD